MHLYQLTITSSKQYMLGEMNNAQLNLLIESLVRVKIGFDIQIVD